MLKTNLVNKIMHYILFLWYIKLLPRKTKVVQINKAIDEVLNLYNIVTYLFEKKLMTYNNFTFIIK